MSRKITYGFLLKEATFFSVKRIPIRILEITNDLFPVKFTYRQRGYAKLVFSERLSNIEITK